MCNNRSAAKAECIIDEEGVRGCGDSKRGDGERRGAGVAVFSAATSRCHPHVPPV